MRAKSLFTFLTLFIPITLLHAMDVNFSISTKDTLICDGTKVEILNTTENKEQYLDSCYFYWVLPNGDEGEQNASFTTVLSRENIGDGNLTLKLVEKATEEVVAQQKLPMNIAFQKQPTLSISSPQEKLGKIVLCRGVDFSLEATTLEDDPAIKMHVWTVGINSPETGNPLNKNTEDVSTTTDAEVTLKVEDEFGCTYTYVKKDYITVKEDRAVVPQLDFLIDGTEDTASGYVQICSQDAAFTLSSENISNGSLASFEWELPDGSTSKAPVLSSSIDAYGRYTYRLSVVDTRGCDSWGSFTLNSSDFSKELNFSASKEGSSQTVNLDDTQCNGSYFFTANSPQYNLVEWTFDGLPEYDTTGRTTSAKHFENNAMISMYAEKSGYGCKHSIQKELKIEPIANIEIVLDPSYACESKNFNFSATATNLADVDFEYFFLQDSTTYYSSEVTKFVPEGVHQVEITTSTPARCPVQKVTKTYEVALPGGKTNLSQNDSHCVPHKVIFSDSVGYFPQTYEDSIVSVSWDVDGDGIADTVFNSSETGSFSHVYTKSGSYEASIIATTGLGCSISDAQIINVGTHNDIKYHLDKELVCANGAVIYTDSSDYKDSTDYLHLSIISEDEHHYGAAQDIKGNPIYGRSTAIGGFDTIGYYDIRVRLEYNECKDYLYLDSAIYVSGPFVTADYYKDCSVAWNQAYFKLAKELAANDTLLWEFYREVGESGLTKVGEEKMHKDDSILYSFPSVGNYQAVAVSGNDTSGCFYTDTAFITIDSISVTYNQSFNARCIADSVFLFEDNEIFGSNGFEPIKLSKFYMVRPKGDVDTFSVAINTDRELFSDTLLFNEKGVYTLIAQAKDRYGCAVYDTGYAKVYAPKASAITADTIGCLPLAVNYTNISVSDTAFSAFYWSTNADINPTDTTNNKDETFSTTYSTKSAIQLQLVAVTVPIDGPGSHGCIDDTTVSGMVNPIIPNVDFSLTDKICTGTPATAVKASGFEADTVMWKIGAEAEWEEKDSDTLRIDYDTVGNYEVSMFVGLDTEYGYCTNEQTKHVDVKDYYAKLVLDAPDNSCFISAEWSAENETIWNEPGVEYSWYEDGKLVGGNYSGDNSFSYPDDPGRHEIVLEIKTAYEGCRILRDTVSVDAVGVNLDFTISKSKVCVGEEFAISPVDTTNYYITGVQWIFGDGTTDSVNVSPEFGYRTVPESGIYNIRATQKEECKGFVQLNGELIEYKDVIEKQIELYKLESRFVQNGDDKDIAGCPPLSVGFTNTSLGGASVSWDFGNGQTSSSSSPDSIVYSDAGTYTASLKVQDDNCKHSISKNITVYPNPSESFTASEKEVYCEGVDEVQISGKTTEAYEYEWSPAVYLSADDIQNPVFAADSSRTFNVTVTNSYNCSIYDSIRITVQNKPYYTGAPYDSIEYARLDTFVKFRPTDTLIVLEEYLLGNDTIEGINYKWEPADYLSCSDCANPRITIPEDIESISYTITMTDNFNCFEEVEELEFNVIKDTKVALPGAFSPNGDGSNDVLYARGWAIRELVELRIYNRWGQEIYYSDDIEEGWDGTFNGEVQPADTYAFILKIINFNGEEEVQQGNFDLVK